MFICYLDIRHRAYTLKEVDVIPVTREFARVPERVKRAGIFHKCLLRDIAASRTSPVTRS